MFNKSSFVLFSPISFLNSSSVKPLMVRIVVVNCFFKSSNFFSVSVLIAANDFEYSSSIFANFSRVSELTSAVEFSNSMRSSPNLFRSSLLISDIVVSYADFKSDKSDDIWILIFDIVSLNSNSKFCKSIPACVFKSWIACLVSALSPCNSASALVRANAYLPWNKVTYSFNCSSVRVISAFI